MGPARRLQVFWGSLRWLPLQREPRAQRRRWNLCVLHRPVQLLQLRQLGLPTVLRLFQHAVVFQWIADPVVPDRQIEDRALDHQRMAVLGRFGGTPGLGGQILWRPKPWVSLVFNNYGMGEDTLGNIGRSRIHTDDSIEIKYYDHPEKTLDKMAFSLTGDLGCEYGGGVSCLRNHPIKGTKGGPRQSFAGWMLYNRWWFKKDTFGLTIGGGAFDNPGRYLTLLQPTNGADAVPGSPYFPASPGRVFKGRVSNLGSILDPSIRTAKVRIEVQNPGIMRLGMFVKATFRGQAREMHTVIPASANLHMHDRDFVFVPAPDKKFRRLEVVSGDLLPDNSSLQEIKSGLKPGRQVVGNALVLDHVLAQ